MSLPLNLNREVWGFGGAPPHFRKLQTGKFTWLLVMMHLAWNLPAVEEVQLAGIRARNRNGGVIVWPWERAGWRRCYSDNFSAVRRWSNGGMILTGENSSTGGKTLYSVGGRWMNEYGAMVEWYWQGKTEVLGEKHYIAWVVDEWMSMEQWWNDTDRGKLKYRERNLSQCHSVQHKSLW